VFHQGALQKEAAKLERQYELERAKLGTDMAFFWYLENA